MASLLVCLLRSDSLIARIHSRYDRLCRKTSEYFWVQVFESNYHKSLDHRSFYFKQADKKQLAPRNMMQELRDLQEQSRFKDNRLRSLSAACPQELVGGPDMIYDYSDVQVHDTCYQVLCIEF